MKKYSTLLVLLVILILTALKQQTNIESNNTSKADFTYINKEYGFSLIFPGYWKDQYLVEDVDGNGVRIKHQPTWLKNGAGTIFQISSFDKSSNYWKSLDVKGNIIDTPAVGVQIIYENDKNVFGLSFPTDVQYFPDDTKLYSEYTKMKKDTFKIVVTFEKIN